MRPATNRTFDAQWRDICPATSATSFTHHRSSRLTLLAAAEESPRRPDRRPAPTSIGDYALPSVMRKIVQRGGESG
jgi:hypothetical protein